MRRSLVTLVLLALTAAAGAQEKPSLFVVGSSVIDARTGSQAPLLDAPPQVCPATVAYFVAAKDVVVRCGDGARFKLVRAGQTGAQKNSFILEPLDDKRTDDPGPSKSPGR